MHTPSRNTRFISILFSMSGCTMCDDDDDDDDEEEEENEK